MRFSTRTLAALSEAVGEIYKPANRGKFPGQVVRAFEAFFGSDIVTYNEFPTDGSAPFVVSNNGFEKEHGGLLQQCAPLLPQNPLIAKLFAQGSLTGMRIGDVMPIKEYQRTAIYNEWYRKVDADYQMGCGFPTEEGDAIWGIAVNQKRREFTERELFLFNLLVPHARQAYQTCRTLERVTRRADGFRAALENAGCGLILFDDRYRVGLVSSAAQGIACGLLACAPREGALLPVELRACVQRLRGGEGEVPAQRAPLTFALEDGGTLTLRLSLDPERKTHCLLLEHERGLPDDKDLAALGLTRREAEVVKWMLEEKTNWEIGVILGISARTVEKHVEKVFAKLAISDRRQLAGRVKETVG